MGLEDIDDDDVPVRHAPSQQRSKQPVGSKPDLNDIFGDLGVPQPSRGPPPAAALAHSQTAAAATNEALAGFFSDKPVTPPAQPQQAPQALDSLFDFGTTERKKHVDIKNESEKYLEAFDLRSKGGVAKRSEPTLGQMKAPSTSAVTAHLLSLMNYYDILGVEPSASVEDIHRNYKKKALELHPDKVGRQQTPEEAQLFKTITKAHEVLTDTLQRAEYDASLLAGAPSQANWFAHLSTDK